MTDQEHDVALGVFVILGPVRIRLVTLQDYGRLQYDRVITRTTSHFVAIMRTRGEPTNIPWRDDSLFGHQDDLLRAVAFSEPRAAFAALQTIDSYPATVRARWFSEAARSLACAMPSPSPAATVTERCS